MRILGVDTKHILSIGFNNTAQLLADVDEKSHYS